ncbi:isochorismatase [Halarcobacter ebronensis]|uniref:Isochorismatase n=1 Tax=Halarcobacter ebronensis TaxID=1462615 RepID=A0A4V1LQP9_9BACT|nr:cysteine hydrolase family protein [Halarcobacter ebronensis]RXJ65458.1 isochorismatase [Halarcobacter ebronensis]
MKDMALLLVDFQNDYFSSYKGAKFPLDKCEEASLNAAKILAKFREKKYNIVHIRHEKDSENATFFKKDTIGAQIHNNVVPKANEKIITKNFPNSFLYTDLKEYLDKLGIKKLIIVGAMSHMCIDATVRAASDLGYDCTVVSDSCATKSLQYATVEIPSLFVHATIMAALEFAYSKVINTDKLLEEL